jgi:hypothetical protein
MMLSELVVDDEWRSPAIIRKFNDPNKDFTTVESKCHATKEFEKVRGTNRWCSRSLSIIGPFSAPISASITVGFDGGQ